MRLKHIYFIGVVALVTSFDSKAQIDFYALDHIPQIKIYFEQSNWDALLDSLYILGSEARLGGDVTIDGTEYKNVGVRYKGYSSYSSTRKKNPFNIDLDYALPDQNHLGVQKIKLSNVIQDPSFIREILSYEIGRKYMPASKANFAMVYVNDAFIGVFTNVESIESDFLQTYFHSSGNTFVKGNPETVDLNGANSNLGNQLGTDISNYTSLYDMKSSGSQDWDNLYSLIDVLNEDPASIETILNVDRTLWMHAFNYTVINFDSYVGYAQNYYLYQDDNGQFNPILWDLNMSFGSYRLSDDSDHWDGFDVNEAKTIDPLQHYNSFSVHSRPLIRNLLENDTYRRMYLAHIKTIVEENFVSQDFYTRGQYMQSIIDAGVQLDTNKFYSYDDFLDNLDITVSDLVDYPGLKDLMDGRATYLMNYPTMDDAPVISEITEISPSGNAHNDFWITAKVNSTLPEEVFLAHRNDTKNVFDVISMFDDGQHNDGLANDSVYGAYFNDPSPQIEYYLYAENDSAGVFAPARAAYEFYTTSLKLTAQDLLLNEIMLNNSTFSDAFGENDAWLELFAAGTAPINTAGLLVTKNNSEQWAVPSESMLAGAYDLMWLDGDTSQGDHHTSFQIAAGDTLYLNYADGTVVDSMIVHLYEGITAQGRFPNGSGTFVEIKPTPLAENDKLSEAFFEDAVFVYPNPASNTVSIRLNAVGATLEVYTMDGRQVLAAQELTEGENSIDTSTFAEGFYLLRLTGTNEELVKRLAITR